MGNSETSHNEKVSAAKASVYSAILLTTIKGVVGFMSGSLGIMAEALHSLLDLGAAVMTLFSVRYSERPADSSHHYGHGKIENLSALAESVLLIATCVWILQEAVSRLMGQAGVLTEFRPEHIWWGFAVMATSIGVDWYRSRKLMHAAKKYRSQALEADALHFSSDILSSSVVILGLVGVRLGYAKADPIAAMGVGLWVGWITFRLILRSIRDLLDTAPQEARESIRRAVAGLSGVEEVADVRVRQAGPKTFTDLRVLVDRRMSLEESHHLADSIEDAVHGVLPDADVMVHTEPVSTDRSRDAAGGPIREAFESVAGQMNLKYHHISLFEGPEGTTALVDLEFPGLLSLDEARAKADALERAVLERVPTLHDVVAHIDVDYSDRDHVAGTTARAHPPLSVDEIRRTVESVPGVHGCHGILFTELKPDEGGESDSGDRGYLVSMRLIVTPRLSVAESHEISAKVERLLQERFKRLRRVHIHQEPGGDPED